MGRPGQNQHLFGTRHPVLGKWQRPGLNGGCRHFRELAQALDRRENATIKEQKHRIAVALFPTEF